MTDKKNHFKLGQDVSHANEKQTIFGCLMMVLLKKAIQSNLRFMFNRMLKAFILSSRSFKYNLYFHSHRPFHLHSACTSAPSSLPCPLFLRFVLCVSASLIILTMNTHSLLHWLLYLRERSRKMREATKNGPFLLRKFQTMSFSWNAFSYQLNRCSNLVLRNYRAN